MDELNEIVLTVKGKRGCGKSTFIKNLRQWLAGKEYIFLGANQSKGLEEDLHIVIKRQDN